MTHLSGSPHYKAVSRESYLTGVEPIVELFLAPDAGQNEAVEDVFPKGSEQGATKSDAKEDK